MKQRIALTAAATFGLLFGVVTPALADPAPEADSLEGLPSGIATAALDATYIQIECPNDRAQVTVTGTVSGDYSMWADESYQATTRLDLYGPGDLDFFGQGTPVNQDGTFTATTSAVSGDFHAVVTLSVTQDSGEVGPQTYTYEVDQPVHIQGVDGACTSQIVEVTAPERVVPDCPATTLDARFTGTLANVEAGTSVYATLLEEGVAVPGFIRTPVNAALADADAQVPFSVTMNRLTPGTYSALIELVDQDGAVVNSAVSPTFVAEDVTCPQVQKAEFQPTPVRPGEGEAGATSTLRGTIHIAEGTATWGDGAKPYIAYGWDPELAVPQPAPSGHFVDHVRLVEANEDHSGWTWAFEQQIEGLPKGTHQIPVCMAHGPASPRCVSNTVRATVSVDAGEQSEVEQMQRRFFLFRQWATH